MVSRPARRSSEGVDDMTETGTTLANRPVWVDLSSSDPAAAREFYSDLFGWNVEVSPDPQYGGYGLAKVDGKDVAGIGPKQSPEAPTAWSLYFGTTDAGDLAARVTAAGGAAVMPPFDVGDQGRMAIFQDLAGAFFGAWQPAAMGGFHAARPNTCGWTELNARGFDRTVPS